MCLDHPVNQRLMMMMFRKLGYKHIDIAANGQVAINMINQVWEQERERQKKKGAEARAETGQEGTKMHMEMKDTYSYDEKSTSLIGTNEKEKSESSSARGSAKPYDVIFMDG